MTEESNNDTAVPPATSPPAERRDSPSPAPEPANAQPRPAADPRLERRATRRGCFAIIFGAILGALVGAVLTLVLLAWLNNGSLAYNDTAVNLRNQLDDEIATRQAVLDVQATAIQALDARQAEVEANMADSLRELEGVMATAAAGEAEMRVTAVYLETRISQAGNAADTLDALLVGLEGLLSEVATTTPLITSTPAQPAMTPQPSAVATTVPTATGQP